MNEALTQMPGLVLGTVVSEDSDGTPLVMWREGQRLPRRAPAVWMPSPPRWSECGGMPVVLGFVGGDEAKPVVLGLLGTPPGAATEPLREARTYEEPGVEASTPPRVLRIESEEELVLECGKAKVALRADGRVEIRGGYLLSRSTGANKIKGGSVHIN
jgi:hypothetical protein